ncbi:restriction endonuclease subunit S [Escherichia coli]|nr:restriction endonuclease subunit S [Escherichia coli O2:H32]EFH9209902.1 restriction endonuclease subunit S [Escherichia coli]EJL9598524.1 restriction endonuclease subunit S [Escherichia coli]HAW0045250.1 restriction endonuclease subunit S [Escherichia coli]HAW0478024.1 restriction endonuclease subunit S [Escherichia coli]
MAFNYEINQLELMQARIKSVPHGWQFTYVGKAFCIRNNLRKPISEEERSMSPGNYPYYGPTKIQGYIGTFEQDGSYALIGEDGDHFLKFEKHSMTQLVDGKCTVNNHAHIIEGTKEASREWFYYYFMHRDIFSFLSRQGAGRYKLNKASLEKMPLLLPPIVEQKKIAQILSTWDKAISVTEKLLTNSQQQKKALMQQLLTGKKRLLDERGVRFSGEWKRVKLGAIADMNSGGTPKSTVEEYYGGNIPWVSISDMTSNGKWIATTEKYLTELGLNSSSARIYPKNSVLYAMYASIGECSIAAVNLTSSQAILGIRPKDCLNYEFLYFYLTSLKEKIKLQGQQGTQSNLNAGMVKEFELDLPSIREQQKIAAVLSVADAEISTLEKKLACLRDEKKALMQQLLTGKRRVKVDEAVAE